MAYLVTFLEGLITFISPCLLPMLPVYLSYFAGGEENTSSRTVLRNALGFVAGFTLLFLLMGAFAGSIGSLFTQHRTAVNVITGLIVIFFGLNFLGVFRLSLFRGMGNYRIQGRLGFFSALVFGAALVLASQQGSAAQGVLLLLCYSAGLGIPFLISALLLQSLKDAFQWIKAHYSIINTVSGLLLILVGILMATGTMGTLLSRLS